jgi:hypothetical protein
MRWLAVVLVLGLAACGKPPPAGPPVVVASSDTEQKLYWASDLNNHLVSLDGYIGFDNGKDGQAIAIGEVLSTQRNAQGKELIRFELERGERPNQLNLPVLSEEHTLGNPNLPMVTTFDIGRTTWQDKDGKPHPLGAKVRVTGRLVYLRVGNAGLWSDEDSSSPTGRRFKPRLTDVVLEPSPDL